MVSEANANDFSKQNCENPLRVPMIRFQGFTDDWIQCKLGELYSIYSGQTPYRGDEDNFLNPTTAWIKTTDLNNSSIISNDENISDKGKEKLRILPINTVLVAMYGGFNQIGRTGMLTYPATINQAISALPPIDDVDSYFLITELNHRVDDWKNIAASSRKDPNITKKDVENFALKYPKIEEQTAIGNFFHTLDDAIHNHQQKLNCLRELKKGYLQQMFPQDGETVPKVRFDGFTGDWTQQTLSEIAEHFEYGLNAAAKDFDGVHKYIRITDINDDLRTFDESNLTSPDINFSDAENYLLKLGDVLFARTGASVGKTYIHRDDNGLVYFAGFLIRARLSANCDKEFVYQNTLTERYNTFIKIMSQRSGQPGVNAQEYASFSLGIPSLQEQTTIGAFFLSIDKQIAAQAQKLEQLKQLKAAYLQKMFI